jgi:hypothetical protein
MVYQVAPLGEDDDDLQPYVPRQPKARAEAAVAMKIAGATYTEIAKVIPYSSASVARQAVERSLAATVGDEDRAQMRLLESKRLERLLRSVWGRATNSSDAEHLSYVRAALALIDRHARLHGLDAPTQMVVYSPAQSEIEAWVAGMSRQVVSGLPLEADIIGGEYEVIQTEDEP